MLQRILRFPCYFGLVLLLLFLAVVFNGCFSKTQGFLLLNLYHPLWLDRFFMLVTNLGDGLFSLMVVIVLLLWRKRKKAIILLVAFLSSGLIAQIMKRTIQMPRPLAFFEQTGFDYPYFVNGINLHGSNSFPSGHTTSAFALATVVVLVFKKKRISLYCLCFAVLTGYSRIYLAQHFLQDVIVGALIGTCCALLSYQWIYKSKVFKDNRLPSYRYRATSPFQHLSSQD